MDGRRLITKIGKTTKTTKDVFVTFVCLLIFVNRP
jgi:hypothetical protein